MSIFKTRTKPAAESGLQSSQRMFEEIQQQYAVQAEKANRQMRELLVKQFTATLITYGPLPLAALCAFYNAGYKSDMQVREAERFLAHPDVPTYFWQIPADGLVRLPSQANMPAVPVPQDYVAGYYDLLHVLTTIQKNPALASTPVGMITDLYGLPSGKAHLNG